MQTGFAQGAKCDVTSHRMTAKTEASSYVPRPTISTVCQAFAPPLYLQTLEQKKPSSDGASGWSDFDLDPEQYQFRWYVDGVETKNTETIDGQTSIRAIAYIVLQPLSMPLMSVLRFRRVVSRFKIPALGTDHDDLPSNPHIGESVLCEVLMEADDVDNDTLIIVLNGRTAPLFLTAQSCFSRYSLAKPGRAPPG